MNNSIPWNHMLVSQELFCLIVPWPFSKKLNLPKGVSHRKSVCICLGKCAWSNDLLRTQNRMEWNGLISQSEQAESNLGLLTSYKRRSVAKPFAYTGSSQTHLHSTNIVSVNSMQNSYSYKGLKTCYFILSFTYISKMVRISRFSPADPSVEVALRGMLLFQTLQSAVDDWLQGCLIWLPVLCPGVKGIPRVPGELVSVLTYGLPRERAWLSFFLTYWT